MSSSTALLVMDYQVGIAGMCPSAPAAITRTAAAIAAARHANVPVLYGRVALRTSGDVSPRNKMFSAVAESGAFSPGAPSAELCPEIAPNGDAVVFDKRRVSAFAGSDLDVVLRSLEIETLVLAGLYTSGVVLSTLRAAADDDFQTVVLADACADPDAQVHDVLMTKVFPQQAVVQDVDTWTASLANNGHD